MAGVLSWNDQASSIKVPDGYKVTLYEHTNYGGQSRVFTADHTNFNNVIPGPSPFGNWNDEASSIKIEVVAPAFYNLSATSDSCNTINFSWDRGLELGYSLCVRKDAWPEIPICDWSFSGVGAISATWAAANDNSVYYVAIFDLGGNRVSNIDGDCTEPCGGCPTSVCGGWQGYYNDFLDTRFYDLYFCGEGMPPGAAFKFGACWYDKNEDCAGGCDTGACKAGCEVSCAGDPCPSDIKDLDLIGQITDAFDKISDIKTILEEITITKDEVLAKLEKARKELAKCVTPAGAYDPERAVEEIKLLYTCQAAKYLRILTEEQEKCYINNFLCCYLK